MPQEAAHQVVLYGFGEAGRAFARSVSGRGVPLVAYDLQSRLEGYQEAADELGVRLCHDAGNALTGASTVLCLVTADQALPAARAARAHLRSGTWWLDGDSCSPGTKRAAAAEIGVAGGRYVDLAIMAPVLPDVSRTQLLLAGPDAESADELLRGWGLNSGVAGEKVGDASMIKMLRSVMVKGREALTAECVLAAERAGVAAAVLDSLQATEGGGDIRVRSAYNLERMMVHGRRRAAEMREVAATLRELGLPDRMSAAAAEWLDQVADLGLAAEDDESLGARAGRILGQMG
ncbi:MAG: DUF1932 domain-containing protein [Nocardioides sp.]|uniref:NAD(P)-dependent oxidoreductase n=1 Tax=Nocardioides sp. TaxID=35761 RepID=UPI0039E50DED